MYRININYFYDLGRAINALFVVAMSNDRMTPSMWGDVSDAKKWLDDVCQEKKVLPRTAVIAYQLLEILDRVLSDEEKVSQPLGDDDRLHLGQLTIKFNNVLESEGEEIYTFFVPSAGAYSTAALINMAELHLSQNTQDQLLEKEKEDFQLAGTCLAYAVYTASGFHAMRALEAEARRYHKEVTGVVKEADWTLDPLINGNKGIGRVGLRDQWNAEGAKTDSPLALIIAYLSTISRIYRNPIMHPEMTLDYETAKLVFDTAALAISAMVDDRVTRIKAKGTNP